MSVAALQSINYPSLNLTNTSVPSVSHSISDLTKIKPLAQNLSGEQRSGIFPWHERAIKRIEDCEIALDRILPNFGFQNRYDKWMADINCEFKSADNPWNKFNAWLEDNGHGKWYTQLASFLAKMPLKVARNIFRLFVNILKAAVCVPLDVLLHPMKAPLKLIKLLVVFARNLTHPETWTKLGIGIIGTSFANATCSSNPMGVIGIGIGAAMSIAGISIGTLKTALFAEKSDRWNNTKSYLVEQAKTITEDLLTGYCLGLFVYGIQKIIRSRQKARHNAEHKRHVKMIEDQNKHLIDDANRKNARAIDEINRKNSEILQKSKNAYIDQKYNEFLEKYKFPSVDRYNRQDQGFSVRWPIEKTYGSPLTELPEGKLVVENLKTGVIETHTNVWIEGYYTTEMRLAQEGYWKYYGNDNRQWIPSKYTYVQEWHNGHWADSVSKTPIYDKFVGYDVAVKGWTPPSLLEMPAPLPSPTLQPLPVQPPLPAGIEMGNENIQIIGAVPAVNQCVENNNE